MSDDVSLAQPPGRLSGPGPASQAPAWQRYLWLWDAYFGVVAAATVVAGWTDGAADHAGAGTGARTAATALVAALVGWHLLLGRGLARRTGPHRWWRRAGYQLGTLVLLVAAASLAPASGLVTFALVPQAVMLWPLAAAAGVVVALLAATWLAAPWLRAGDLPRGGVQAWLPGTLELVLLLGVAVVLGLYVQRIAQQSGERAELIAQLDASRAEVARLSHEAGVAAERQRLAGDIHDTVAQGLASVVLLLQSADAAVVDDPPAARGHLALAMRTARDNLADVRALVAGLTPAPLDGASLPEALRRVAARCRTGTTVEVSGDPRPLPTPVEVVLLRAIQESLTNVDKHAAATGVEVRLAYGDGAVTLAVADDGAGAAPDRLDGGYGLAAMRSRVGQVGGELAVDSVPGRGTTVRVTVPA